MIYKFISLFCLFPVCVSAQLVLQTSNVQFNPTYDTDIDSVQFKVYNQGLNNQKITGYKNYNTYTQSAFTLSPSSATILAQDSAIFTLYFHPRHNIFHNSEIILFTDNHRGTLRIDVKGQGKYFLPYYNSTENMEEQALKDSLKARTGLGYHSLGYNSARSTMFSTIDNWAVNGRGAVNDKMECVYTGRIVENYPFTPSALVNTPYSINTEHTFPQSLFSQNEPMRSDLHHLFPTDDGVNNSRGNNPFGVVSNPTGSNGGSKWDGSTFEPRDEHKGNVARAMLYFVMRYQNYSNYLTPQEAIFRDWNIQFPPSTVAKKRNEDIYTYQLNRNPFVDYPQFLERISSISSQSIAPVIFKLDMPEDTVNFDTVNGTAVYQFYVVNSGNQVLNLDQFTVGHPELSLISATPIQLSPGDAYPIQVKATPSGSIQSTLSFVSQGSVITVPVLVNNLTNRLTSISSLFQIYPNPGTDKIHIQGNHIHSWVITDSQGKIISQGTTPEISTLSWAKGLYFIHVNGSTGQAWIKQ